MPEYQIEMLWGCPQCGYKDNRGLSRHCVHCGKAKDHLAEERMPDDTSIAAALQGESKRKALAGADWSCRYCATLQNSLEPHCGECGALRGTGVLHGTVIPQTKAEAAQTSPEPTSPSFSRPPVIKEPNPISYVHQEPTHSFVPNTGNYRDPPTVLESEPEKEIPVPFRLPDGFRNALIGFGVLAAIGCILWLLFRTREYDVTVSAVSWRHTVEVQRFHSVQHEGWDVPSDAENTHDEGMRFHHYDHLRVGSHPESQSYTYACNNYCTTQRGSCRTIQGSCTTSPRNCTSNKNGTASCTGGDRTCSPSTTRCDPDTRSCPPCTGIRTIMVDDYRDFPISRIWYTWSEWEWGHARSIVLNGQTIDTRWPSESELAPPYPLRVRESERFIRDASYEITFSNSKDTWKIQPHTLEEFSKFTIGSRRKIRANAAGQVTVL